MDPEHPIFQMKKFSVNDDLSSLIELLVSTMSNLLNTSAAIFLEPYMYMSYRL